MSYRIDPPPLVREEEAASFYTNYYKQPKTEYEPTRSRFWQVVEAVPKLAKPGGCVLDLGCGEGSLCAELKAAGWNRVFGIDVSGARIARARRLHPGIAFEDGPLGRGSLAGAPLELAIMDNIIEHLPDPARVLSEVHGRLLPGGRIVVITPNMACGNFRLLGRRWTPELAPHAHIFLFMRSSLSLLLERTGFAIEAAGDFHTPGCGWRRWLGGLVSGDVKTAIWRSVQGTGALYGRVIHAGPMLYVVGSRE